MDDADIRAQARGRINMAKKVLQRLAIVATIAFGLTITLAWMALLAHGFAALISGVI